METTIKIKNIPEGFQSFLSNGTHTIIGDEPVANTGTNLGFSPSDLVLSGLALCKVATVRSYARKKNWAIGNVHAQLSMENGKGEKGLTTSVKIQITIEGEVSKEQRDELLRQADNCFVHRMLNGEWNIASAEDTTSAFGNI